MAWTADEAPAAGEGEEVWLAWLVNRTVVVSVDSVEDLLLGEDVSFCLRCCRVLCG